MRTHAVPESTVREHLEHNYRNIDPWGMETSREQFRFIETNRIIVRELAGASGRFDSVLEIGCGEGHQSAHLAGLCDDLVGIDVVEPAVRRARERVPDAEFCCGELAAQPWIGTRRFGLVTACEVLFYFPDVKATLTLMSRLGRNCIVTCFEPSLPFVEVALHAMPLMGRHQFRHRRTRWHAFWWRAV